MKQAFKHNVDIETAKRAVEMAWESYKGRLSKYKPEMEWVDDSTAKVEFSIGLMVVRGEIEISQKDIEISASVPGMFALFKKRAVLIIKDEIRKWTAKAANSH